MWQWREKEMKNLSVTCDKLSEICCKLCFDGKFDSKFIPECRIEEKVLKREKTKIPVVSLERYDTTERERVLFAHIFPQI